MLKSIFSLASQLFSLTRKTQQHDEDIKALRQELRALADLVKELRFEQQRNRDRTELERENLLLRLDLLLTKERRLPELTSGARNDENTLKDEIARLERENSELREQLRGRALPD